MTRDDARAIAKAVAAAGCFVGATCRQCGVVKRPLRDVKDDDGEPCDTCRDASDGPEDP